MNDLMYEIWGCYDEEDCDPVFQEDVWTFEQAILVVSDYRSTSDFETWIVDKETGKVV